MHLVWPNTESLISQPFMGLSKIRLLLQDPVSPRYVRFFWRYHIFHLLFCPTHAHIIRSSMGVYSRICSEAGRLDFSANKSNRPASEQILLAMAMDERMMSACVGQNKSTWWIKKQVRQQNIKYDNQNTKFRSRSNGFLSKQIQLTCF